MQHILHVFAVPEMFMGLTCELSDAGGPERPNWQPRWPARIRSSDFVRHRVSLVALGDELLLNHAVKRLLKLGCRLTANGETAIHAVETEEPSIIAEPAATLSAVTQPDDCER